VFDGDPDETDPILLFWMRGDELQKNEIVRLAEERERGGRAKPNVAHDGLPIPPDVNVLGIHHSWVVAWAGGHIGENLNDLFWNESDAAGSSHRNGIVTVRGVLGDGDGADRVVIMPTLTSQLQANVCE